MNLEQVLPAQRQGKKIRRKEWLQRMYYDGVPLLEGDILAEDWEVLDEPECNCYSFTARQEGFHLVDIKEIYCPIHGDKEKLECSCKWEPQEAGSQVYTFENCPIHGNKKELGCVCADYPLGHVNCPIHGRAKRKIELLDVDVLIRSWHDNTTEPSDISRHVFGKINEIVEAWNKENE